MQVSQASLPCQIVDQKPFFSTLFPGKFIMWRRGDGLSRLCDCGVANVPVHSSQPGNFGVESCVGRFCFVFRCPTVARALGFSCNEASDFQSDFKQKPKCTHLKVWPKTGGKTLLNLLFFFLLACLLETFLGKSAAVLRLQKSMNYINS